jgi:glycosyltransferase involved in cell wall biosynthesis
MNISIVCASHKGKHRLPALIESIYQNTIKPYEIILSVTDINDIKLIPEKYISELNIKTYLSEIKNQSKQRKLAISKSSGDFIIQFDDDLILENRVLEKFLKHFNNNNEKKIISAVVLLPDNSYQSFRWNQIYNSSQIFKFIISLLNGFKTVYPMSITKSGRIIPLMKFENENGLIDNAEWLNSCLMYNKEAIKDVDYEDFNFNKSYFEDVFFSHSLYKKNYKLIVDSSIKVRHHFVNPTSLIVFIKTIYLQYKLVKKFNKSIFLFLLDVLIFFNLYLISSFLNCFKK